MVINTLSRVVLVLVVLGLPGLSGAGQNDVARYFELVAHRESSGDCSEESENSTAMGCYQLTEAALKQANFKDDAGRWVDNEYHITSKAQFLADPEANYAAMLEYTRVNWGLLACSARLRACAVGLDPAALLAGAHILGATGIREFLECEPDSYARCLRQSHVDLNKVGRDGLRDIVVERMEDVLALELDIPELTVKDPQDCGAAACS